jgi:LCP family protein required for cell wall assembly
MADPPSGDRPNYKVYKAGSDAPPRSDAPPPGGAPPQQPQSPSRQPQQQPGRPTQPANPQQPQQPPQYRTYRSRKRLRDRILPQTGLPGRKKQDGPQRPKPVGKPRSRARTVKRVILAVLGLCTAWILLSVVLFFISAGTQEGVDEETEQALNNSGSLLTGSTILVLGSDARPADSQEPGAGGPSRADSIMLLRVGLGSVNRLSIPRDARVDTGEHAGRKINEAYSQGPAFMVETVEEYLGNDLEINHLIEVNFENFPEFINTLGGIDVTLKRCVRSPPFGEFGPGRGRKRLVFRRGENHLDGFEALGFSRIRVNSCAPNEDDRARAARQQQVLSGIRDAFISPRTFVRLPWVAWDAPRTVRSDMQGFGMTALALDIMTGGAGKTNVLRPETLEPLQVSQSERRIQVRRLLGKD